MSGPDRQVTLGLDSAVVWKGRALLVGCGDGTATRWMEAELPAEGADLILLTTGEPLRIAGLYGMLAAMRRMGRERPVRIVHLLSDDRVGPLIGAFLQAGGESFPVIVEADFPGSTIHAPPFIVHLRPAPIGLAFRVEVGGRTMTFNPDADA